MKAIEKEIKEIVKIELSKSFKENFHKHATTFSGELETSREKFKNWHSSHLNALNIYSAESKKNLKTQANIVLLGNFLYPIVIITLTIGLLLESFWQWFVVLHWGYWLATVFILFLCSIGVIWYFTRNKE